MVLFILVPTHRNAPEHWTISFFLTDWLNFLTRWCLICNVIFVSWQLEGKLYFCGKSIEAMKLENWVRISVGSAHFHVWRTEISNFFFLDFSSLFEKTYWRVVEVWITQGNGNHVHSSLVHNSKIPKDWFHNRTVFLRETTHIN